MSVQQVTITPSSLRLDKLFYSKVNNIKTNIHKKNIAILRLQSKIEDVALEIIKLELIEDSGIDVNIVDSIASLKSTIKKLQFKIDITKEQIRSLEEKTNLLREVHYTSVGIFRNTDYSLSKKEESLTIFDTLLNDIHDDKSREEDDTEVQEESGEVQEVVSEETETVQE